MKNIQDIINNQKTPKENKKEEIVQLVGFKAGNEEFAVPILSIQEILKPLKLTRVPQVPKFVLGVVNLRGAVIPIIDLRQRLNIKPEKDTSETRYVVLKNGENKAGFVVDKITQAIRIDSKEIKFPPETLDSDKSFVIGVGKQDDKIFTILNVDKLLKRDF